MTAPTEAEIRATISMEHATLPDPMSVAYELTRQVDWFQPDLDRNEPGTGEGKLWTNLRPTEALRLRDLLSDVYDVAEAAIERAETEIFEAAVAAALTFAQEYPDAPRPTSPPRPPVDAEDSPDNIVSLREAVQEIAREELDRGGMGAA